MRKIIFLFTACWLLTLSSSAQQPAVQEFKFTANQSVYVIAVKSAAPRDPSVWMQLHRNSMPPGQVQTRASSQTDPSGRATLERSATERNTLEREAPIRRVLPPIEPGLQKLIAEEFLKQKKFKLADSPETADFIFFAHGEYIYSFIAANGKQGGGGVVFGSTSHGDTNVELNTLAKLSVAAIPASDYRQWQSDVANLFEKAKWQEVVWGEFRRDGQLSYQEPPTKKLVQQFHKQALKK
jgi:hypothetical protein